MSNRMDGEEPKRRRRVDPDGKRAMILGEAQKLFADHGFARTTVALVATNANVAVGSVHRIFGDKKHLLLAAQADVEQRFIDAMTRGWETDGSVRDRFDAMLVALFDEMVRLQPLMPMMALRADAGPTPGHDEAATLRATIRQLVGEAVEKGEFRTVPIEPAAEIAFGMVDAAMRAAFSTGTPQAITAYIDVLGDMLVRSLADNTAK
jgi:AcrR family transcriptional regulator